MKNVLIVDDEERFMLSLVDGLSGYKDKFSVLTAGNGSEAIKLLESEPIELVVTDLRMPEMDGFELLAYMGRNFPSVPAIVMSAFGTPEIETRIKTLGSLELLEKPIELEGLAETIIKWLELVSKEGVVTGITVPSFLQLIEMEEKTCLLEVITDSGKKGLFYFNKGELYDAVCGDLKGDEAALEMIAWEQVEISFKKIPKKKINCRITNGLMPLIMEGMRRKDELDKEINEQNDSNQNISHVPESGFVLTAENNTNIKSKGEQGMSEINEVLGKFKSVDGFRAVGVFSPNGEMVAEVSSSGEHLTELGALANDLLLKAQKTTEVMGVGRGNLVHIQAPKAQVIARCLNEATDFSTTNAGRAHIHMVLILESEGNLAMGKMKLDASIQELASHFR